MTFKKNKLIKIILIYIPIVFILTSVGLTYFSPYKYYENEHQKMVVNSVIINKPIEEVYNYLGDSDNAKEWSLYVDHISTLNANEIPDGSVGSTRRCFQYSDEKTGNIWDEEILEIIPNKKRVLSIFNMKNFIFTSNNVITEQTYEVLSPNTCKLSFISYIKNNASWVEKIAMSLFGYKISNVFQKNINNVKVICENK